MNQEESNTSTSTEIEDLKKAIMLLQKQIDALKVLIMDLQRRKQDINNNRIINPYKIQ